MRGTNPMTDPLTQVQELEAAALSEMEQLLHGTALCRVDQDRAASVKYLEGRVAALSDLRRTLRRQPHTDISHLTSELAPRWATGPKGRLWEFYRQGGTDLLRELS